MLVLLTSAKYELLSLFWAIAFLFLGLSCLICLGMVIRRIFRNRKAKFRDKQRENFQAYIINQLRADVEAFHDLKMPACHIQDVTDIFLHHFQTLKGQKKNMLQDMIYDSGIEEKIVASTRVGTRGVRMRAVRVLSYLDTQNSLQVIFESLSSDDKYVRLTAMRSLVKRKAVFFLDAIIESCLAAFPADYKLLSGILSNFGNEVIEPLEKMIQTSKDDTLITACLETLVLIMPMQTSVDFERFLKSTSESVRAAALSLSAITKHESRVNPLVLGLTDRFIKVKIRAAKIANSFKRSDLTSELFELTSDPFMWVRYWAFRGIWVSGASGQKLVNSMKATHSMAENVELEMSSGYV